MVEASPTAAAFVASQLREFLREPTRHRPAWIHGERPLPDGQVVLKLALGRFAALAIDDGPAGERETLVQAARAFVRDVCLWERSSHYQVLCLGPDATDEAIRENYRLLMALLHPDRQDPDRDREWPSGSAQRVNEAHDALSDADRREEYDRAMPRLRPRVESPPDRRDSPAPRGKSIRVMQTAALVVGVTAALLLLQAWWVDDTPKHVALLEGTLPANPSGYASSDVSAEGLPRFLATKPSLGLDLLQPLETPRATRRLAALISLSEARSAPISPPAAPSSGAIVEAAAPAASVASPPAVVVTPVPLLRLAQATSAPAARKPNSPEVVEIELLVARLVSSYEQGDADALMGLFAAGEPGFFKAQRTRGAYADFFRATRDRRLRVDRLDWRTEGDLAHLRGDATVSAEYVDGRGSLERKVPLEIDVSLRDGQARMTALALFPEVK
jgi:hypothetical protein